MTFFYHDIMFTKGPKDRCLISWNNKTAVIFRSHEVVGVKGLSSDKRKGAKFRQISN